MEADSLDQNGYTEEGHQEEHYDVNGPGMGEEVPRLPSAIEAVLRGVWPFEKALWHSSPASVGLGISNTAQVRIDFELIY